MGIEVNGIEVQFCRDNGTEIKVVNKDTFGHIGAPSLQECDEVARMENGRTATFLGKGRAVFKLCDHVLYIAPRGSLNLLSYPTMQCL
jgi:hypothetical protein